jgi:hypothetical protein
VVIQSNEGVTCEVTASVQAGKDGPAGSLSVGSVIELTVSVEITLGAVLDSGAENGVMQFAHDLFIDTADVVRVVAVEPLGAFATTREEAQVIGEEGANGGARFINGFTMSFDQGVAGPALAYRVTLEAVGLGKALVTVSPASLDRIAADTPFGVKLGHTDHQGDPGSAVYPDAIAIEVATALGNCDGDSEVTLVDYACFYDCALSIEKGEQCGSFDFNGDQSIDLLDFGRFQAAFGSN